MRSIQAMRSIKLLGKKIRDPIPYRLAVAQVTANVSATTRTVKVIQMEMSDYLKMFFNRSYTLDVQDAAGLASCGDIVLVSKLRNAVPGGLTFGVEKVLFKLNDLTDPITGKKKLHDEEAVRNHLEQLAAKTSQ